MKIEKKIMGVAVYKEKEYAFIYENNILSLLPSSEKDVLEARGELFRSLEKLKDDTYKDEWIKKTHINASGSNGSQISFFVFNDHSNNNGILSFYVEYFLVCSEKYSGDTIQQMVIRGKEVDYFYDLKNIHNPNIESIDNKVSITGININKNTSEEKYIGNYEFENKKIEIFISNSYSYSYGNKIPIISHSNLLFKFEEALNLEETVEVYNHCKHFFIYICSRRNINFDNIKVYIKSKDGGLVEGVIKINDSGEIVEKNTNSENKKIMKFKYIQKAIVELFESIANNSLYMNNIVRSIEDSNSYSADRIILNFVAFESEFSNLCNEYTVRSDEYNKIKDEILEYLNQIRESKTGKEKKYVKEFIKKIEITENSLSNKIKKTLEYCEEIMDPFLKEIFREYNNEIQEEMCDRMNGLRNNFVHGNMEFDIMPKDINYFKVIELLLYAVRLKHAGLNKVEIQKSLNDLKGYHLIINQ